ncbi:MAG: phosphoglycerol geranylgeranyltransferase [Bacteroidota bacterium]|jgi:putative glycerol-1-phosphate prenyltransferase|nr:phosphoglycerol geranylgeranyltransferase [Bacteroidota bacterium]MCA6443731.1 phosphoglycerol geranylgeranyltransferase [Bacteroidota bacterium]
MKFNKIIQTIKKTNTPLMAMLVDPDKLNLELVKDAAKNNVFCILVGGSSIKKNNFEKTISQIKKKTKLPIVIFPGDEYQVSSKADGMLFLSLISGNNAEYLIGKQSKVALSIKKNKIKTVPTAYVLINGGKVSTTQKVTNTKPLSLNAEITARCVAAELLGFQLIYLEAGSGAESPLSNKLISNIKKLIQLPIIAGGGINTEKKLIRIIKANPNLIVIGNAFENDPSLLKTFGLYFRQTSSS